MPSLIVDRPNKPLGPLVAGEVTPTSITLQWSPPKDDGGVKVDRYVIEKRVKGSSRWQKVCYYCNYPRQSLSTSVLDVH